jgi:hypothetical protein
LAVRALPLDNAMRLVGSPQANFWLTRFPEVTFEDLFLTGGVGADSQLG